MSSINFSTAEIDDETDVTRRPDVDSTRPTDAPGELTPDAWTGLSKLMQNTHTL